MKTVSLLGIIAGLTLAANAMAADMPDLAKKNGCAVCHKIDSKSVGPAWMEVSKKYQGDKKAAAMLAEKIKKGGGGVWGGNMPAQKASDADIKELVKFILGLAK